MARKNIKRRIFLSNRNRLFNNIISLLICSLVFIFFAILFFIHDMPDFNNLESRGRRASIVFESYDGKQIASYGDLFGDVVEIEKLPKYVVDALVSVEDRRFYGHCGVDIIGILRAMYTNIIARRISQGGSTLTQQLAKNLFLSPSKSIRRKVQEFVLALWLEKKFTKKQILSIYLNRVYFGSCTFGIDAAAQKYFGKKASQLSLYEAAKLIGLLKAPTTYSPFHNPTKSHERASVVLECMVDEKYITNAEMKEALLEKDRRSIAVISMDENRYFTDWALEQLHDIVGADGEDLIVKTTMDSKLQKIASHVIRKTILEHGIKNGASQMALVAIDKTGAVRAMVGGHTYGISQFNRALALRSFGSAFKYFVFLSALENGYDINDQISDMPITIGSWSPKNYGYNSVGSITLTDAFVKSVNTCSVRIAQKIGIEKIAKKAEKLGITSEINRNFSSALGSSGVNLLEMTAAFGTTMIDGIKMHPYGIISIKTKSGKVLYRAHYMQKRRVIAHDVCEKMKFMMKELMERGTGRKAKIPLNCYAKTGTSNDSRDASFIGFIPPIVVGVWTGNDDNAPMHRNVTGGSLPAIAWKIFMLSAFGFQKIDDEAKMPNVNEPKNDSAAHSINQTSTKSVAAQHQRYSSRLPSDKRDFSQTRKEDFVEVNKEKRLITTGFRKRISDFVEEL